MCVFLERSSLGPIKSFRSTLDGVGLQLFHRIQGDYLAILGVPILQLFARLRQSGIMAT
jgi:predicted house-cleaning NTP pyrophosphatase (Maf/HAM1 superfamily)